MAEIVELTRKVAQLERDMYRGNGKPGITTRMAVAEGRLDTQDDMIEQGNRTLEELKRQGNRIMGMVLAALLSIIGLLIMAVVRGH